MPASDYRVLRPPSVDRETRMMERMAALEEQVRNTHKTQITTLSTVHSISCASSTAQTYITALPTEPSSTAARDMRLGPITPSVNCWWEVSYDLLVGTNAAAWQRIDGWVQLMQDNTTDTLKADADNYNHGQQYVTAAHNAFVYITVSPSGIFKLQAGQTYWARIVIPTATLNSPNCFYYRNPTYFKGRARVAGLW